MRIACIGKGGSGKSTVSAALATHCAKTQQHLLVVDADINRHLSLLLDIPLKTPDLGNRYEDVFHFLEGTRVAPYSLKKIPHIGSIPVSKQSKYINIRADDLFLKTFANSKNNISLITAGTYNENDLGTTCIHVKLKGLELAMHRLHDSKDEVVIVDVTAGTDPLSTTLAYAYDLHVVVVEPTMKSIRVYKDYLEGAKAIENQIYVLVNKINEDADREFVQEHIPREKIIGEICDSPYLARFNQGETPCFLEFVDSNNSVWENVVALGKVAYGSRSHRLEQVKTTFINSCQSWFNSYYNMPLDKIFLEDINNQDSVTR